MFSSKTYDCFTPMGKSLFVDDGENNPPALSEDRDLNKILWIADIERITGRHRMTISRWMKKGNFPKPRYVAASRAWTVHQIDEWLRESMTDAE